jgi:hypothetical protein
VSADRLGIATSLGQFARSIGGAVGVALMGAVMTASLSGAAGAGGVGHAVTSRDIAAAVHRAFVCGAILSGLAWLSGFRLPHGFSSRPTAAARVAKGDGVVPDADGEEAA